MKAKFNRGQHVVSKGLAGFIKHVSHRKDDEWRYSIGIADVVLAEWVAESDIKEYAGDQTTRAI